MAKKKVRIRAKRLDQIDETKLSLAVYLIARSLVEDKTIAPVDEAEGTDNHSAPVGGSA
jgi:hypothetical protein